MRCRCNEVPLGKVIFQSTTEVPAVGIRHCAQGRAVISIEADCGLGARMLKCLLSVEVLWRNLDSFDLKRSIIKLIQKSSEIELKKMTGGGDCEEEPSHRQVIYPPGGLRQLNIRLFNFFDAPVTWFREKVVKPNQKEYPWYHQKFPRVREIDQCYTDEHDCIYEANQQFKKDRQVDTHIINILRYRVDDCVREEYPDHLPRCIQLKEDYEQASANWFAKYGDLGAMYNVKEAFMKQKHRLLWERRHGPVGSGMKKDPFEVEPDEH